MEKSIKKLDSHKQDAWPCNGANKYQPKKTEDAEQRRMKFRVCWIFKCRASLLFLHVSVLPEQSISSCAATRVTVEHNATAEAVMVHQITLTTTKNPCILQT
jgi:hypothetical protein